MSTSQGPDWQIVRQRAELFPEAAFQFVREGLAHTVTSLNGDDAVLPAGGKADALRRAGGAGGAGKERTKHISGQQLCMGLRDLALSRYGQLAGTVLRHWNIRATGDFGTIVYALIDRGEMRASDDDTLEDFQGAFDFDEVFCGAGAKVKAQSEK